MESRGPSLRASVCTLNVTTRGMGGSDASGAQGGLCRGQMPAGALGGSWNSQMPAGALGGSWRGQMPTAHLGVCGGVRCQWQIIPLCVYIIWLCAWKSGWALERAKERPGTRLDV